MSNSTIPQGAVWECSPEARNRIIAAVDEDPVNREQLVPDLYTAYSKLLQFRDLDSDQKARERKELFGAIVKDAINLKERLLAHQEYAARALFPFPDVPRGVTFLRELSRIAIEAKVSEQQNSNGAWARLERPLHEWFAAEILPEVFKRNFPAVHERHPGEPVGFSRPSRGEQPGGPYIRFAVAVMGEMGMSISPGTVARALLDVRHEHRARRKERSTTVTASRRPSGW
jgi:hypothetical protein